MISRDTTRPRVFMSWKTTGADDEADFGAITARGRLGQALHAAGYNPWRGSAPEGLAEARAAVVIVSPVAMKTQWMLDEAELLLERAASDPAFVLVALSTDDIYFSAIRSGPYERLVPFAVDDTVGLDKQVDEVLERLAPLLANRDA